MRDEWRKNQQLAANAFELTKELLPNQWLAEIHNLIYEVNEWGEGFEWLVDALLENNAAISQTQKRAIDAAADAMSLNCGQENLLVADS